jgi:hypothetical protein
MSPERWDGCLRAAAAGSRGRRRPGAGTQGLREKSGVPAELVPYEHEELVRAVPEGEGLVNTPRPGAWVDPASQRGWIFRGNAGDQDLPRPGLRIGRPGGKNVSADHGATFDVCSDTRECRDSVRMLGTCGSGTRGDNNRRTDHNRDEQRCLRERHNALTLADQKPRRPAEKYG